MNNVKMFQAHKEPVRSVSFSPTDAKFASCSDDGTVRVWDFFSCTEERVLRGHGADVKCVDWHPTKGLLASGSKDNQQPVKIWEPKTGTAQCVETFLPLRFYVKSISVINRFGMAKKKEQSFLTI